MRIYSYGPAVEIVLRNHPDQKLVAQYHVIDNLDGAGKTSLYLRQAEPFGLEAAARGGGSEPLQRIDEEFCLISLRQIPGFFTAGLVVFKRNRGFINFPAMLVEGDLKCVL